ncbi:MAG: leucyl aminopeptidase [Patescibacteria group bacterium]
MKFQAKVTDVTKIEADLLAVFAGSEEARKVDGAEEFDGEQGDILFLHSHGNIPAKRVAIVGLGKISELTVSDLQTIAAKIGKKAKEVAAKTVAIALPKELQAQAIVEGLTLGTYTFSKHKSEETRNKEKHIEEVSILTTPPKLNAVVAGISRGETVSQAVMFARDLVNEPPSFTTPTHLADVAGKLVKGHANMSCEVFGPKEMKTLGMEAILGIARGSDEEPRFIHLSYKGGGGKTVCLVGKGITFDTGGLSLKDSKNMETMKLDMAGAAAILGVFSVLPILKPNINVVGLIAATENMPGPKAIKPGDVVAAMNGKTIEILNTDAEGRVVLADALSYAGAKVKSDAIVDLATLTGACMVALGEEIAGMFTDDVTLAEELERAATDSGEHIWSMPLARQYKELVKSDVADVKNISGTKYGGAINGALFLAEFAPLSVPWAHLDIAGPAFAEKDAPLTPKGGTGFGVRMLLQWLLQEK